MTLTRKGTRATAADTAEDILEYDPKTIGSTKKEKEDNENLECKKRNSHNGLANPSTPLAQRGRGRWGQIRRCRWPSSFNRTQLPQRQRKLRLWGRLLRRRNPQTRRHCAIQWRIQQGRSFIGAQRRIVVVKIVGEFRGKILRRRWNRCRGYQRRRRQQRWQ